MKPWLEEERRIWEGDEGAIGGPRCRLHEIGMAKGPLLSLLPCTQGTAAATAHGVGSGRRGRRRRETATTRMAPRSATAEACGKDGDTAAGGGARWWPLRDPT